MKSGFIACALFILVAPAAYAATSGSTEGPPGCGWRATVTDVKHGDDTVVDMVLSQQIGTCMYDPGPCGKKDDPISAPIKKGDLRSYHAGQIAQVWVTGSAISFDRPQCIHNPAQGQP